MLDSERVSGKGLRKLPAWLLSSQPYNAEDNRSELVVFIHYVLNSTKEFDFEQHTTLFYSV